MAKKTATKEAAQFDLMSADRGPEATAGAVATKAGHQPKPGPKPKAPTTGTGVATIDPKEQRQTAKREDRPGTLLSIVTAVMQNPNVPVEKVEALFNMQERAEKEAARRAFTAAKLRMRPHLPVIDRDGKLDATSARTGKQGAKTRYATFENIMERIDKVLQDHGFDLYFTTESSSDGGKLNVIGHLDHVDGHSVTTSFPMPAEPSGSKNPVQAWMSTLSYGKRGDTIAILNLRTRAPEDQDRDGNPRKESGDRPGRVAQDDVVEDEAVELCTQDQIDRMRESLEDCGAPWAAVRKTFEYKAVSEIPASRYQEFIDACKNYKDAHK